MGTIGSSLSSSTTGASTFTGTSSFSKDFQNVIDRSVAIATLPVNLLKTQQTALTAQSTELSTLDTKFTSLQAALQNIQDALGGSGMQTTVSSPAVATVSVGDGAVEGNYGINVTSIGVYASSLSSQTWNGAADPSGSPTTYKLVIGGQTYSITPANNGASTVAAAISSQYGNLVRATAVNIGQTNSPDYRIALKSATLGPLDLKIQVPAQANLQWKQAAASGSAASQSINSWDASGDPSTYTLSVDGAEYNIAPADNSASTVAAALNGLAGSPVVATVVDVGTSDSHDYRILVQSTAADAVSVDLRDAWGNSLQQSQAVPAAGSAASQTAWSWDATPDASGAPTEYTLNLGDTTQTFTVDDNSATGVAAAINGLSGSPVQATVVDMGTGSSHDYRIQLVNNAGATSVPGLARNTPFDLQNQGQPPGELAQYEVSNSGVTVSSNTRSVAVASGTTVTLQGAGTTDITVTRSTSALSAALSGFADAYNAVAKELLGQRGQASGALQGNSLVVQLSAALSNIGTYSSIGQVNTLASLGLNLSTDGNLTYSPYALMATDITNSSGVTGFLGSLTGGGFLQAATNALNGIQDTSKGLLKNAESDMTLRISSLATTISDKQDKISALQLRLQDQMARADSLIAAMEQQYSFMSSMFTAMQTANQMYSR